MPTAPAVVHANSSLFFRMKPGVGVQPMALALTQPEQLLFKIRRKLQ
jgi:hypothetical protein